MPLLLCVFQQLNSRGNQKIDKADTAKIYRVFHTSSNIFVLNKFDQIEPFGLFRIAHSSENWLRGCTKFGYILLYSATILKVDFHNKKHRIIFRFDRIIPVTSIPLDFSDQFKCCESNIRGSPRLNRSSIFSLTPTFLFFLLSILLFFP